MYRIRDTVNFILYSSHPVLFTTMYCIQHCFICRPSDATVSGDAGIEPRTVATSALAVWHSNHSARSHPTVHTWDTWWLVSRASGRGVVDTPVDPLWSAFRHSCWFLLSPKYRLPPGCGFCSFFTIFVFCSFCNVLLPFSLSISYLPGFFLCCQAFELSLEMWELLFSS